MLRTLLAIDPGWATGWSYWRVHEDEPIERVDFGLISGGWHAFEQFLDNADYWVDEWVLEDFIQDGRATQVDENAFIIKGMLIGMLGSRNLTLQRNALKRLAPDNLLKQHGYWVTGKQVGWKDGNDVNDSQRHALAWAHANHRPSQEFFWTP